MKPRLALLLVAIVPLVGPLACRRVGVALTSAAILFIPLVFGLGWPAYMAAWACAQLLALFLTKSTER